MATTDAEAREVALARKKHRDCTRTTGTQCLICLAFRAGWDTANDNDYLQRFPLRARRAFVSGRAARRRYERAQAAAILAAAAALPPADDAGAGDAS